MPYCKINCIIYYRALTGLFTLQLPTESEKSRHQIKEVLYMHCDNAVLCILNSVPSDTAIVIEEKWMYKGMDSWS